MKELDEKIVDLIMDNDPTTNKSYTPFMIYHAQRGVILEDIFRVVHEMNIKKYIPSEKEDFKNLSKENKIQQAGPLSNGSSIVYYKNDLLVLLIREDEAEIFEKFPEWKAEFKKQRYDVEGREKPIHAFVNLGTTKLKSFMRILCIGDTYNKYCLTKDVVYQDSDVFTEIVSTTVSEWYKQPELKELVIDSSIPFRRPFYKRIVRNEFRKLFWFLFGTNENIVPGIKTKTEVQSILEDFVNKMNAMSSPDQGYSKSQKSHMESIKLKSHEIIRNIEELKEMMYTIPRDKMQE